MQMDVFTLRASATLAGEEEERTFAQDGVKSRQGGIGQIFSTRTSLRSGRVADQQAHGRHEHGHELLVAVVLLLLCRLRFGQHQRRVDDLDLELVSLLAVLCARARTEMERQASAKSSSGEDEEETKTFVGQGQKGGTHVGRHLRQVDLDDLVFVRQSILRAHVQVRPLRHLSH